MLLLYEYPKNIPIEYMKYTFKSNFSIFVFKSKPVIKNNDLFYFPLLKIYFLKK